MTGGFTVLIVDDERHNRNLLTELLKDDYRLILAKSGEQAIERAREHLPDLILLDVIMPGMDGHAVIRTLKQDDLTRGIPVIFITALDSFDDQEIGLELGAVDYIAKPFHPPIVRVRVRNHLQLVQQRRLLEQLAMLDSLTGIPNRRRFNEVFEQEWRRCQRFSLPLSLVVADIDHFKRFNDTYGHAEGDEVLRRIAALLQRALRRSGDFVCRYGGEEFVVLLPGLADLPAQQLAEATRLEAAGEPLSVSGGVPLTVTLSMGGATCLPSAIEPDGSLFQRADRALYAAKDSGRNCVAWALPA